MGTKLFARELGEEFVVGRQRALGIVRQQRGDLVDGLVNHGRDDVRGPLAGDLRDPLAEVGLERRDTSGRKRVAELDLLGRHGFRLHDALGSDATSDVEHGIAGLFRCRRA